MRGEKGPGATLPNILVRVPGAPSDISNCWDLPKTNLGARATALSPSNGPSPSVPTSFTVASRPFSSSTDLTVHKRFLLGLISPAVLLGVIAASPAKPIASALATPYT